MSQVPVQPAVSPTPDPVDTAPVITVQEAVDLALKQASAFRASQINEQIAEQDVRQAQAAFFPKVAALPNLIYTSPSLAGGNPRPPSFLGANAITEYQAILNAAGEIDLSGRLRAALNRSRALS